MTLRVPARARRVRGRWARALRPVHPARGGIAAASCARSIGDRRTASAVKLTTTRRGR